MNFLEYCLLNQKNFDQVKSIEKQVYPSRMQTYQDFDNIEDLLDYADCDGQIDCIVRDDWYAIFCNGTNEVEIIDFASRKPLTFTELIEVRNKLQSFGDKLINMNARQSTSYRLIMAAAKRGMFEILSDEPNNEFGEPMHQMVLKIKPQKSFKEWFFLQEAIDANTKELLLKAKAPKDQLDAFVKELEDEPTLIDKKTAFQRFQSKFNIQKKEKDEDAQRKHFASVPNTTEDELKTYDFYKNENPQVLKEMMELLRKFIDKKLITLKFENDKPVLIRNTLQGEQKFDTPDFTRFMSSLHGIQASLNQFKGKGNYFNPIEEELNHQNNLVAKGDNVWVFKGHAPDVCRIYGKGHPWCISSSTSAAHWFSYRVNHHQTQYFVFDYNKDENDPARYVNPGVAPEGRYSEWVDARNQHSEDPEDRNSQVGINGYSSINEYKKYLASKGIPLDTWKTTPPEDWEKRLSNYDYIKNFQGAKNDSDPRVFPMYLKIVSFIKDYEFETLTEEQKKEFILGKTNITYKQLSYVKEKFKGEYVNSLDLEKKILFAGKTDDQDLLLKLAQNPNLRTVEDYDYEELGEDFNESDTGRLLKFSDNKDEIANLIVKNKSHIDYILITNLLKYVKNQEKFIDIIFEKNKEFSETEINYLYMYAKDKYKVLNRILKNENPEINLTHNNVFNIIKKTSEESDINLEKIAELIINKQPELSDTNVAVLMNYITDKDKFAEMIINKKKKLSYTNVDNLMKYVTDKDKIAELIINKQPELSDTNVFNLLHLTTDKDQIAQLLGSDNMNKLSDYYVFMLLYNVRDKDKDKMAKILGSDNISKLSDDNVYNLLRLTTDKDKIAKLLGSDNISKLSDDNVYNLLDYAADYAADKKQMAEILDKYHQKKTPEIQKEIDKYLS